MKALTHRDVRPDGTVVERVETLARYVAQMSVERSVLEDSRTVEWVWSELRERLDREVDKAGRMVVGDIAVSTEEDWMRDALMFRAEVWTRESDEGEWRSIWAAVREDREWLAGTRAEVEEAAR